MGEEFSRLSADELAAFFIDLNPFDHRGRAVERRRTRVFGFRLRIPVLTKEDLTMRTKAKELPAILTIADTMAYLSCSRQHVYDLLKAGRIRTYKIGRRRYIDADSLAHLFLS